MKLKNRVFCFLLGMVMLITLIPSALAADGGYSDAVTVSYDYVTEFDDGGKDYVYIIGGVKNHYLVPPEDFDPLTATDEKLKQYGFPARPDGVMASSELSEGTEWYALMENYSGTPEPQISILAKPANAGTGVSERITTDYTTNWSGYVSNLGKSSTKFYTQAEVDYKQPTISAVKSNTDMTCYWIGFGGDNSKKLVQAGTCTKGKNDHRAWYEYLSDATGETVYMQFIDSLDVNAGDKMHIYISFQKANNAFNYYIANNTTGESARGYIELDASKQFDGTTVEWIVERARMANGTYCSLGDYDTMTMTNCKATLNTSNTWLDLEDLSGLYKMIMKYAGKTLSSPGSITNKTEFTCTFENHS